MMKPNLHAVGGLFPIYRWSRNYDLSTAVGDLIAGITVALTLVPQSIAYASLAGLEPQYGLYASFVGGIVYAFLGTCPQINIGPSALLSLLTFTYTNGTNPEFAILLCFVAGIVQIVAGTIRLGLSILGYSIVPLCGLKKEKLSLGPHSWYVSWGFLVEFVSLPVVSGFTSAAAVTIASSQIKGLLGLRFSSESFMSTWVGVVNHIGEIKLPDALLSIICCIVLIGMKMLKDIKIKIPEDKKKQKSAILINRVFWFFGVARNAVVVALATVVAFFVHNTKDDPIILTGSITPGLPMPKLPSFYTEVGNTTYTGTEMLGHLGSGLVVVPLVGIISNVAIAKAFAKGKSLDATQEIIALGICNLIASFFKSFPVNGSFSRSAVSDASGVRTPAAGFYTGFIVILTLLLLTPYFYFIPRATLASVIVCAVLHMVDVDIAKRLWKTNRFDLIPLLGTFILCLGLGIEIGLICGVGIDAILLMYYHSRPSLEIQCVNDGILPAHYAINFTGGYHFAGAERIRSKLIALKNSKLSTAYTRTQPQQETIAIGIEYSPNEAIQTTNEVIRIPNRGLSDINRDIRPNGNFTSTNRDLNIGNGLYSQGYTNCSINSSLGRPRILVFYCKSLRFMDFTFLQSVKSLVTDCSRTHLIVWCDVQARVKTQLEAVLTDTAFYCDSQQLRSLLLQIEENLNPIGDTHL